MLGFRLLRAYDPGVHLVRQLAILVGDLFAEGEFPGGVLLASGALVDHAQVVVRRSVLGLQLNGGLERRPALRPTFPSATRERPRPMNASAKLRSSFVARPKCSMASLNFRSWRANSPSTYSAPALDGSISNSA